MAAGSTGQEQGALVAAAGFVNEAHGSLETQVKFLEQTMLDLQRAYASQAGAKFQKLNGQWQLKQGQLNKALDQFAVTLAQIERESYASNEIEAQGMTKITDEALSDVDFGRLSPNS